MLKVIAHKIYTKRSYLLLLLVPLVSFLLLLQTETALAGTTCTQSGDTTYCSDPTTGQSTTYNQYGDNIYGSDGSSYTMIHFLEEVLALMYPAWVMQIWIVLK